MGHYIITKISRDDHVRPMGRRNRLRGYVRNRETGRVDRSAVGYKSFL